MQKLVLILIAFIAVVTFIRAFDNTEVKAPDAAISTNASEDSAEKF